MTTITALEMGYGYDLDNDGYIIKAGHDNLTEHDCTGDEPWIGDDIKWWKLVDGHTWTKLTVEEYEARYGPLEA